MKPERAEEIAKSLVKRISENDQIPADEKPWVLDIARLLGGLCVNIATLAGRGLYEVAVGEVPPPPKS